MSVTHFPSNWKLYFVLRTLQTLFCNVSNTLLTLQSLFCNVRNVIFTTEMCYGRVTDALRTLRPQQANASQLVILIDRHLSIGKHFLGTERKSLVFVAKKLTENWLFYDENDTVLRTLQSADTIKNR